jgi:hypothetical protein
MGRALRKQDRLLLAPIQAFRHDAEARSPREGCSMTRKPSANRILEKTDLDAEMAVRPPPPSDLPRPWNWRRWRQLFVLGFLGALVLVPMVGWVFNIRWMRMPEGVCTISLGLFMFVGIYMLQHFNLRSYYRHYSWLGNKAVARSIRRYRKARASEALHEFFTCYQVDGAPYFLVWFVPGMSNRITGSLGPGAEPLLMNPDGQWLEDEALFHKVLLMWGLGRDFRAGFMPFFNDYVRDCRGMKRYTTEDVSRLPELLEENERGFHELGLESELGIIRRAHAAKCALLRNSLDLLKGKIEWGDAHGWMSVMKIRYEDALRLQEAESRVFETRRTFVERHALAQAEEAALKLYHAVHSESVQGGWRHHAALYRALGGFAAPLLAGQDPFHRGPDGLWQTEPHILEAFRSRVIYARQVDADEGRSRAPRSRGPR